MRTDRATGKMEQVKVILYTIKDGIVFNTKQLLADVRELVVKQKELEAEQAKK